MAFALIGHGSAVSASSSSGATTPGFDSTGGNLGIIICSSDAGSTPAVSDSKGNTWTARTLYTGTNPDIRLWYCRGLTVGAGHTASVAGSSTFAAIAFAVFSGAATTPFDVENGATGAIQVTRQPGSVTPSVANELLVTGLGISGSGGGTPTIGSGFTVLEFHDFVGGASYGIALAYLIQGAAAAVNPTWTQATNTGQQLSANIATFKPSGASIPPFLLEYYRRTYDF